MLNCIYCLSRHHLEFFFCACALGKVSLQVIESNYEFYENMSTSRYYSNSDMTWMHLLLININMLFLARSKCMYCFVL